VTELHGRRSIVVALVLGALACKPPTETQQVEGPAQSPEDELADRYTAAVADAKVAEESEIYDQLTAITATNAALKFDEQGRVLVVTWTSWDGYDGKEGQALELGVEVWVTMAPQLQDLCRTWQLADGALDLRLEQLMGLPPNNGKTRLVQLWISTDGLFRPSPDAEITDSVAALAFPEGATADHVAWIENLQGNSYGENGYPWTRLGYTYDWSPDAKSEIGLSEFVARKGITVMVESVVPQAQYCAPL
jgi:hypothetical protein